MCRLTESGVATSNSVGDVARMMERCASDADDRPGCKQPGLAGASMAGRASAHGPDANVKVLERLPQRSAAGNLQPWSEAGTTCAR